MMRKLSRFLSLAALLVICLTVHPLASVYAQESPTETPVPGYTLEISQFEGDFRIASGKISAGQINGFAVLRGDSTSIIARFCGNPENAPTCSRHTPSELWQVISDMCPYHPEVCAISDPALSDASSTAALEMVQVGETLSAGDEIFTGDESGAILKTTIGRATGGAGSGITLMLAQQSSLNITELSGTPDAPEIHLRLDAGLLAILPGDTLPGEAAIEIALPNDSTGDPQGVRVHSPLRIVKVYDRALPAVIVGHDPDTGDVVVSVLDGTATLGSQDQTLEIPAGMRFEIKDFTNGPLNPQVEPMTDQDKAIWVSALHYGEGDPSLFPILAPPPQGEPEPFPIYALVHSSDGQSYFDVVHTVGT